MIERCGDMSDRTDNTSTHALAEGARTETITASLNRSIEQNAKVWRELAGECTDTVKGGRHMKRTGKLADGMIQALLTPAEYEQVRELPPPPVCFLCGKPSNYLMHIGYESEYDEERICPRCLDEAIGLLKAHRQWQEAGCPKSGITMKTYRIVEDNRADAWNKALERELDEHAEAWDKLSNM